MVAPVGLLFFSKAGWWEGLVGGLTCVYSRTYALKGISSARGNEMDSSCAGMS
jgi:hypothetical protein